MVPDDRVVPLPDGIDLAEADAAGVVAVTAWRALIEYASLEPADYWLIHDGSGGVGHAAIQLGAAMNARVFTTAAPEHERSLYDLGVEIVLNYAGDDL
jgi:NADPH:quinone reductase-like Zn-dependent oxidoreductase